MDYDCIEMQDSEVLPVSGNWEKVRSRKWMITINNPIEKGYTHDRIREILSKVRGSTFYWCMCDEEGGKNHTYHTHIFLFRKNDWTAKQIDDLFPKMNRKELRGSPEEVRNYILKDGEKFNKKEDGSYNYLDSQGERHIGINFSDTFEEFGECPEEHQGKASNSTADYLLQLIKCGATDSEIVNQISSAYKDIEKIQRVRSMYRDEQFTDSWRDLTVTYIFGVPGAGKSRSVMDKYGYRNVYRVTDYKHPFDTYDGQDVVVFEDYRSNFKITDILNYLDGYPLLLPCRYFNRQACFTKVYITSNLPLEEQHKKEDADSKKALYRRIHAVVEHTETDRIEYDGVKQYFDERRCNNG